jgi:hypothetical protein
MQISYFGGHLRVLQGTLVAGGFWPGLQKASSSSALLTLLTHTGRVILNPANRNTRKSECRERIIHTYIKACM